jgi:hypothetical protein
MMAEPKKEERRKLVHVKFERQMCVCPICNYRHTKKLSKGVSSK